MSDTLYDRLGGEKGIAAIVHDTVALHHKNPTISKRFQDTDDAQVEKLVTQFFCMGSGGPQKYEGKSMPDAHRNMNINDEEFMAVVDDVMAALEKNSIVPEVRTEVLAVLYSLRPDVVRL